MYFVWWFNTDTFTTILSSDFPLTIISCLVTLSIIWNWKLDQLLIIIKDTQNKSSNCSNPSWISNCVSCSNWIGHTVWFGFRWKIYLKNISDFYKNIKLQLV